MKSKIFYEIYLFDLMIKGMFFFKLNLYKNLKLTQMILQIKLLF